MGRRSAVLFPIVPGRKKSAKSDRLAGSSLVDSCSMDDKVCCEG